MVNGVKSRTFPCIVYLFLIGLRDLDMCTTCCLDGLNSRINNNRVEFARGVRGIPPMIS